MKRTGILFCLFWVAFSARSGAQPLAADSASKAAPYRNSVYLEFLGNAGIGSVNYERLVLTRNDPNVAIRVGGLLLPDRKRSYLLLLPTEVSFINGKRNLKFEFGFGLTYVKYYDRELEYDGTEVEIPNTWLPVLRLGGRYQVPGSPFFARLAFTPQFIGHDNPDSGPILPWGGLSFGYSFGRK